MGEIAVEIDEVQKERPGEKHGDHRIKREEDIAKDDTLPKGPRMGR